MKYYYPASRAHWAYVMALDFGMKFLKRDGFWTPEGLLTVTGAGGYRIEIAEESLELLEPRVGDVCVIENERIERCDEAACQKEINGRMRHVILIDGSYRLRSEVKRIIQRDGKSFHWPEQSMAEA